MMICCVCVWIVLLLGVGGEAAGSCMQQHEIESNNTKLHATTRNCMQQHEIACNNTILHATGTWCNAHQHQPQNVGLKRCFLHVATTKNATTRNCNTTGTRCFAISCCCILWACNTYPLQFVVCVDSSPRHPRPSSLQQKHHCPHTKHIIIHIAPFERMEGLAETRGRGGQKER